MTFTAEPITGRQALDLSFLLTHASHVLATRMAAAFAEIGITPREYCVLAHAMGGQYTQIELAKVADLDKTTMLNTMDYLEREGYAERRRRPTGGPGSSPSPRTAPAWSPRAARSPTGCTGRYSTPFPRPSGRCSAARSPAS
jgi:hypothetical protein